MCLFLRIQKENGKVKRQCGVSRKDDLSRKEEKMDEKQRQSKKKKEGKGFPFAWEEK